MPISDELIMAFADGELAAPAADRVREAIRTSANVRRKFESFRDVRELLARAFDPIREQPVPDRLRKAVIDGTRAAAGKD